MQFSTLKHMSDLLNPNNGGNLPHKVLAPNSKISRYPIIHVLGWIIQENKVGKKTLPQLENHIRRVIEKLIEDKVIEIRNEDAPNVTNNPLPTHNKEHVVGMVDIYEDCGQTCRTKRESRDSKEESSMVLEPIQKAPIIVNGASSNFGDLRKLVLYVPGAVKRREVLLNGPKLYIPGKLRTFGQNQESVKEPVVIRSFHGITTKSLLPTRERRLLKRQMKQED
ncbi:hypothetical protein KY284_007851 [Solanum tuberosum]|nr:hypothetical protein KY284_007851 [Solanum tuberosum]